MATFFLHIKDKAGKAAFQKRIQFFVCFHYHPIVNTTVIKKEAIIICKKDYNYLKYKTRAGSN